MPGYSTEEKQHLTALGAAIRHFRETLGWSQEQLAERVELHRTYIGGVERGERNLCLLNILSIADALGVAPGGLIDAAFPSRAKAHAPATDDVNAPPGRLPSPTGKE